MIAKKAQLTVVPWDGYLKYYNLGEKVGALGFGWGHLGGGTGRRTGRTLRGGTLLPRLPGWAGTRPHSPAPHPHATLIKNPCTSLQHPDLIEKQRRVYSDIIAKYI